ncbi:EcsC family protein [Fusobacterium sp.]|uniref:EcsC family protein n=1 Tax=Fusobacterium sp. TaxID=68766 RepID=UPI002905287D|nr:EcsC family protein [Fusobacterium sp.]MDU1912616.1 EcsC family protein [Fusobacterium sp.]
MDENKTLSILDACYVKAINGIPMVSEPIEELVESYLRRYNNNQQAAKEMIANQVLKCTTSGFLSGLGGIITLPVTLPVNLTSVLYIQMRMIAGVAYAAGYDINDDTTKTLVYLCLAGSGAGEIIKSTGIKVATMSAKRFVQTKVSGETLKQINKKIGFMLLTKAGTKRGAISLIKVVPIAGGIVGGTFDALATKAIAKIAMSRFFKD